MNPSLKGIRDDIIKKWKFNLYTFIFNTQTQVESCLKSVKYEPFFLQYYIGLFSSWQGSGGIGALIYDGLSHIVSYGVFSENGTQDVSKGRNGLF